MPWCHGGGVRICPGDYLLLIAFEGFDSEYVKIDSGGRSKVEKGVAILRVGPSGLASAP